MGNNFCCGNKPQNQVEMNMGMKENEFIQNNSNPDQKNSKKFKKEDEKANSRTPNPRSFSAQQLNTLIIVQKYVRRFLATKNFLSAINNEDHHLLIRKKERINHELITIKNQSLGIEKNKEYGHEKPLYNFSKMNDNFEYIGNKENGLKQGFGIQKWKDGALYKGYFNKNKANGYGVFKHYDGDLFKGEFNMDRASGYGIYLHANGALYQGNWLDDCQNGTGEESWNDESHYLGDYYQGKKQGIGKYHKKFKINKFL